MLCNPECPRGTACSPISNVVASDGASFVCVGHHGLGKDKHSQDVFRHCFVSGAGTDSMFDYDLYDLKSVVAVMSETILFDEIEPVKKEDA